jgi:zinc protease
LCATLAQAQGANWPSESAPRPLAPKEFTFPPYEIRTLSNGMQVMVILHHEQPAVTMRLLTRAGAAQDPERKRGIAELVAHLLDQGTTTRSAQQIAEQIDFIGGAIGTGSGTDLTYVNAVVMKDSFAFGMDLIGDIVRNPAFSPEEIERQRERAISSLQVSDEDPDYVASVLFDRLVYGFHPYGLPGSGTPETLSNITQDDLRQFHRQYFVPNNMILAIVGDVTGEDAFGQAERVFGKWARGEVPPWRPIDPPADHRGQAGRGADRDPRWPVVDSTETSGLSRLGPGGEDPRWRGCEPVASCVEIRARPHLWRRGEQSVHEAGGRLRRRDEYADRNHR